MNQSRFGPRPGNWAHASSQPLSPVEPFPDTLARALTEFVPKDAHYWRPPFNRWWVAGLIVSLGLWLGIVMLTVAII